MVDVLDIIVFGATGFTGKYTLPHIYKFTKAEGRNLSWGIAGRSESKLKAILSETAQRIGVENLDYVPIIIADVSDEESIQKMVEKTRVIINCCGPYDLYGEAIVKYCVENGTHLVDASGEPKYIEGMRLKYNEIAEKNGSYIVSACGMDCIPSDMGVVYIENNFEGTLNSVEIILSASEEGKSSSGSTISFGAYHSAILTLGNVRKASSIKRKLNVTPLPVTRPKLSMRSPMPSRNAANKWIFCLFFNPDRDIMQHSQRYFYEQNKTRRPIQTEAYAGVGSFSTFLALLFIAPLLMLLSQCKCGIKLLLKYPRFFTFGYISNEDPSVEKIEETSAQCVYYGEGWKEKLTEGSDQPSTPPNRSITGKMTCNNPGYGFTCATLSLCAIMFLTEKDKLPTKGGVYTTAAAFSKTSIIQQLQDNGAAKFEITSVNDIGGVELRENVV